MQSDQVHVVSRKDDGNHHDNSQCMCVCLCWCGQRWAPSVGRRLLLGTHTRARPREPVELPVCLQYRSGSIRTHMHSTHLHTYLDTYIHTYIHAPRPPVLRPSIHASIRAQPSPAQPSNRRPRLSHAAAANTLLARHGG